MTAPDTSTPLDLDAIEEEMTGEADRLQTRTLALGHETNPLIEGEKE